MPEGGSGKEPWLRGPAKKGSRKGQPHRQQEPEPKPCSGKGEKVFRLKAEEPEASKSLHSTGMESEQVGGKDCRKWGQHGRRAPVRLPGRAGSRLGVSGPPGQSYAKTDVLAAGTMRCPHAKMSRTCISHHIQKLTRSGSIT